MENNALESLGLGALSDSDDLNFLSDLDFGKSKDKTLDPILGIYEIDTRYILNKIWCNLAGMIKNKEGEYVRNPNIKKPLMTIEGATDLVNLLDSHVDRNTILNYLEIEDIYTICRTVRIITIRWICENYKNYDIPMNLSAFDSILTVIDNTIFITCKRSFRGGEREYRKKVLSYQQLSQVKDDQQKKKGFLSGLFSKKNDEGER